MKTSQTKSVLGAPKKYSSIDLLFVDGPHTYSQVECYLGWRLYPTMLAFPSESVHCWLLSYPPKYDQNGANLLCRYFNFGTTSVGNANRVNFIQSNVAWVWVLIV